MVQKRKLQVFVSSTYNDLTEERQAAVEAILSAGHIPAGMELFAADGKSQMEVIKRWIDESDVFLLILGGRYGSIEPDSGKSYIHLEYEYASEKGKPLFAVVILEAHLNEKVKAYGLEVTETQHSEKLNTFRELVTSKMVEFWSDPRDIQLAIHKTLGDFETREDVIGWIRADQAVDAGTLEEMTRLSVEEREERKVIRWDLDRSILKDIFLDKKRIHHISEKELERISAKRALEFFYSDESDDVRLPAFAVFVAHEHGNHESHIPFFVEAIGNKIKSVGHRAIDVLEKIGRAAVPDLLRVLENPGDERAGNILKILLTIGKPLEDIVPVLVEVCDDDEWEEKVRRRAVEVLGNICEGKNGEPVKTAVSALMKLLKADPSVNVQGATIRALGQIKVPSSFPMLVEALKDPGDLRGVANNTLVEIGEPAIPALTDALKHENKDIRAEAANVLRRFGTIAKPAVSGLIEALNDKYWLVRRNAVRALEQIREPIDTIAPALTQSLNDQDNHVVEAITQFFHHTKESTVPVLIEALTNENSTIRLNVADTLYRISTGISTGKIQKSDFSSRLPSLVKALDDENPTVRLCIAKALGHIGDVSAVCALARKLTDEDEEVRK